MIQGQDIVVFQGRGDERLALGQSISHPDEFMSNISKITEILGKAKEGQFISLKCEGSSTDFFAAVVQLGTDKVQAVKAEDWEEGWPKEEPTDSGPLCFTAEQAGSTVRFDSEAEGAPIKEFYPNMNLQYSRNGQTWTVMDFSQPPADFNLANVGDKIYFKAVTENPDGFSNEGPVCMWKMNGKIAASGNIQYLLTSDGLRTDVPAYCYWKMFDGCTSLTTAPALLATTLAERCYQEMFQSCTSLTSAPELPAQTLADSCYSGMFNGCIKFSDCHMKAVMQGVYNPSTHGDTTKTVVYDL